MDIPRNYKQIEQTGFRFWFSMGYKAHYFRKGNLMIIYHSLISEDGSHSLRFYLYGKTKDRITVAFTSSDEIKGIIENAERLFLEKM